MRFHRSLWVVSLLLLAAGTIHADAQSTAPRVPNPYNPGLIEVDHPETFASVVAISDVHGMYDSVIPLLMSSGVISRDQHWNLGKSLLIIVGDSIDKGPKSIEVLDLWMKLSAEADQAGGKVIHLLGNHEAEFLAFPNDDKKAVELFRELQSRGMSVDELTNISKPRGRFLRSMPVAARVGNWLFCHSGFIDRPLSGIRDLAKRLLASGDYEDPFFIGKYSILEAKDWWRTDRDTRRQQESQLSNSGLFGVVFGHQPKALNIEGAAAISEDRRLIKIDNGMAPQAGSNPGSIVFFNHPAQLNSMRAPDVWTWRSRAAAAESLKSEVPGAPTLSPDSD